MDSRTEKGYEWKTGEIQLKYSQPSVSVDAGPVDTESRLYSAISYKELEHPRIWVSTGAPGTNPQRISRDDCTNVNFLVLTNVPWLCNMLPLGETW